MYQVVSLFSAIIVVIFFCESKRFTWVKLRVSKLGLLIVS